MLKYLLPLSLTILFSFGNDLKENILLFHLDSTVSTLEIINKDRKLVDHETLNKFLVNHSAHKIERWIEVASGLDVYNGIRFSQVYRVYFNDKSPPISEIKKKLELLDCVDVVEFDYKRKPLYTPNDPRYNNQWFIEEINSNDAWDLWDIDNGETPGNREIILSSVDLGVNWQHEDLVGNLWQTWRS